MEHLLGKKVKILDPDYDEAIGRVVRIGEGLLEVELEEEHSELGTIFVLMFEREVEEVVDNA